MEQKIFEIESISEQESVVKFLDDRIYEFNSSEIMQCDGEQFTKIIRDADNNIIAGITGWSWAHISEITLLWVKESFRRKNLGAKLLAEAERHITTKGCSAVMVRSYSFQAPRFYEKHGYEICCTVNDFPKGHKQFCLMKTFMRSPDPISTPFR
jgi:ribosomal protein S18 acetylase RimI-like enzyme